MTPLGCTVRIGSFSQGERPYDFLDGQDQRGTRTGIQRRGREEQWGNRSQDNQDWRRQVPECLLARILEQSSRRQYGTHLRRLKPLQPEPQTAEFQPDISSWTVPLLFTVPFHWPASDLYKHHPVYRGLLVLQLAARAVEHNEPNFLGEWTNEASRPRISRNQQFEEVGSISQPVALRNAQDAPLCPQAVGVVAEGGVSESCWKSTDTGAAVKRVYSFECLRECYLPLDDRMLQGGNHTWQQQVYRVSKAALLREKSRQCLDRQLPSAPVLRRDRLLEPSFRLYQP